MRLLWNFADTCISYITKLFLSISPLALIQPQEKLDNRTSGWRPQKTIKKPLAFHYAHTDYSLLLLGIPHRHGTSREDAVIRWQKAIRNSPWEQSFNMQHLKACQGENQLFFHAEAWLCLSAAQTLNESWEHVSRHQKVNPRGFSVCLWNASRPNVQRELQDSSWGCRQQTVVLFILGTHAWISWISETFSCRRLIWNSTWLSTEASLHKKRTALDNLRAKQAAMFSIMWELLVTASLYSLYFLFSISPGSSFLSPAHPSVRGSSLTLSSPLRVCPQNLFLLLRWHFKVASPHFCCAGFWGPVIMPFAASYKGLPPYESFPSKAGTGASQTCQTFL